MDRTFKVENVEYELLKPNGKQMREAKKIYNKGVIDGMREQLPLRSQITKLAEEAGLWTKEKEKYFNKVIEKMRACDNKLNAGGIELEAAKDLALELKGLREEAINIKADVTILDACTAEGTADALRRDYLISECTIVKKTKKKYYKDLNDYYDKIDDYVAICANLLLTQIMYGGEDTILDSLTEYKFLKEYEFMDDDFNLVNEKGEIVDEEGNPIKEEEDKDEFVPFLKDGKPVKKETAESK